MAPSCHHPPALCHCFHSASVATCLRKISQDIAQSAQVPQEMLELKQRPIVSTSRLQAEFESKQPKRLLLALGILLIALAAVLVRDHEFWFGGSDSALDADGTSEVAQPPVAKSTPTAEPAKPVVVPAAKKPATTAKSAPQSPSQSPSQAPSQSQTQAAEPGVVATRTVLPPLDVEVVAGDTHRTLHPGSNATKVEIKNAPAAFAASTNAAEHERISTVAASGEGSYEASYPLLAQHMNVQGSVVLQAVIGADGMIQNLRVLSGPSILTAAAQQAVRDWHFKPYLQNGQPVETKARITVNFSIKVANSSKTS